jgi:hypothetical protein
MTLCAAQGAKAMIENSAARGNKDFMARHFRSSNRI